MVARQQKSWRNIGFAAYDRNIIISASTPASGSRHLETQMRENGGGAYP